MRPAPRFAAGEPPGHPVDELVDVAPPRPAWFRSYLARVTFLLGICITVVNTIGVFVQGTHHPRNELSSWGYLTIGIGLLILSQLLSAWAVRKDGGLVLAARRARERQGIRNAWRNVWMLTEPRSRRYRRRDGL